MTRATLLALAERVEAATGADSECVIREASWAVNVMLANRQDLHNRVNVLLSVEAYESAAMSLVPSGIILRNYQSSRFVPHSCEVALSWAHGGWLGNSDHSFALALAAACLRALAVLEQDNG